MEAMRRGQIAPPRRKQYDLYEGAKNGKDFIAQMERKIKKEQPEVNISEIVESYYKREPFCGYTPDSNKIVFRHTLDRENIKCFDLKPKKRNQSPDEPVFLMTAAGAETIDGCSIISPMKSIKEEDDPDAPPSRMFTLHMYKLP